jgi:hypothetical protein
MYVSDIELIPLGYILLLKRVCECVCVHGVLLLIVAWFGSLREWYCSARQDVVREILIDIKQRCACHRKGIENTSQSAMAAQDARHVNITVDGEAGIADNGPRRRTYTRVSGSIDVSTFRQLESTIEILSETIRRGEEERNQLMATINSAPRSQREVEFGMSVTSNSNSLSGVQSNSNLHRDPTDPGLRAGGRTVTPQRRVKSPAQRGVSPTRSVSPSAAYQRIHSVFSQQRGGSGEGGNGFSTVSDQWKLAYHANNNEDLNSITHKKLLADNRAMIQMIDALQRDQRKAESEYESRLRRMQRALTDKTERCSAATERVALMEIQFKEVQKQLRPGARSEVLNSQFTRTLSSYKNVV